VIVSGAILLYVIICRRRLDGVPRALLRVRPNYPGGDMTNKRIGFGAGLERLSSAATRWTGSTPALLCAVLVIVIWLATGPLFGFSDTWQLVVNTGTTIVTFVMVFLIQRSQNKDSLAVQLKLNELVAALEGSSNRLIDVEDLSEDELAVLHKYYRRLAVMAKQDDDLGKSHSIDEAQQRHRKKHPMRGKSTERDAR
jgi:low affinity Fe/Cu permease